MKHTAVVPKGFIRYHVLESLAEKPMSGSEIMEEIERKTEGRWKPSPNSIYPLLAWLQDNGYVEGMPRERGGLKRYRLTDSGKVLLKEQKRTKMKFNKSMFFAPPFFAPWSRIPPEKLAEFRTSVQKLITAFLELRGSLEERFSERALEEFRRTLNKASEKLERINKRLRTKGRGKR